jgi:hypothetical protein
MLNSRMTRSLAPRSADPDFDSYVDCSTTITTAVHLGPSNRYALNSSHPDRHFPEHQHSGRHHHLELQRHGSKGRPSRTHTSHREEEATKPPASSLLLGFPDTDYPLQGKTIVVTRCGRICLDKKRLISARYLPDKLSASKKSTTTYGWSASWIMIWGISAGDSSARTTRKSVRQKSYLCLGYVV